MREPRGEIRRLSETAGSGEAGIVKPEANKAIVPTQTRWRDVLIASAALPVVNILSQVNMSPNAQKPKTIPLTAVRWPISGRRMLGLRLCAASGRPLPVPEQAR